MVGRWLAGAKAASTRMDKMVAGRVTESYLGLFLKSRHDDGSRATAIAKIGALEVRLVEMQTVNVCESLWVELYDRDRQIGVDSCKCTDLDEAIDATQLLIAQARQLNSEAEDPVCAAIEPLPSDLQGFRCGSAGRNVEAKKRG